MIKKQKADDDLLNVGAVAFAVAETSQYLLKHFSRAGITPQLHVRTVSLYDSHAEVRMILCPQYMQNMVAKSSNDTYFGTPFLN